MERITALEDGKLMAAGGSAPSVARLANKNFLRAASLWKIPPQPRSLNPIERSWACLKQRLGALDLKDVALRCACLGKMARKENAANFFDKIRQDMPRGSSKKWDRPHWLSHEECLTVDLSWSHCIPAFAWKAAPRKVHSTMAKVFPLVAPTRALSP